MNYLKIKKIERYKVLERLMMTALVLSFVLLIFKPEFFIAGDANQAAKNFQNQLNGVYTLFADVISTIGSVITLWGIGEWGLSMNEGNGTMGSQAFKRIFGGVVTTLAPQVVTILGMGTQTAS